MCLGSLLGGGSRQALQIQQPVTPPEIPSTPPPPEPTPTAPRMLSTQERRSSTQRRNTSSLTIGLNVPNAGVSSAGVNIPN